MPNAHNRALSPGGSVRGCMCVYTHTHTHAAHRVTVLQVDVSPGVGTRFLEA